MTHKSPIARLHCLTIDDLLLTHTEQAMRLCQQGARWIQLRMKRVASETACRTAQQVKAICDAYDASLIINDSVDIAQAVDATGVHLGAKDLPCVQARTRLGQQKIIGGTVNTIADAQRIASDGIVDYVGVGPYRFTPTKVGLSPVLDRDTWRHILQILGDIPVIAIGGVTFDDAKDIFALGAYGLAIGAALHKGDFCIPDCSWLPGHQDTLQIAEQKFTSRLFLGTGQFASGPLLEMSLSAARTELVTVALKRISTTANKPQQPDSILDHLDRSRYRALPNTSGARNAREAVFVAQLAREALHTSWIKLEIHPDPKYLMPDPMETLKATEQLVAQGFTVLPYVHADPVLCKQLEQAGAATVMPLGAPIGSSQGLRTRDFIQIIIEQAQVPVIVDAGIGTPAHAAEAMQLGAAAVLINTAIACSPNPIRMAQAFRQAVQAGRTAFLSQEQEPLPFACSTSPLTGFLQTQPVSP